MERVRPIVLPPSLPDLARRVPLYLGATRFQENVFALPFAYTGMILAADGLPTWQQFIWITVAMVAARTLGMAANRVIDRHIDAANPRTADRHLPRGRIRAGEMTALALVATGVFLFAASQLNTLALVLAPVAVAYLVLYPYTKRYTWTTNLMLGWALAIAPAAAWIGVRGSLSGEPVLLSAAVALWAGSFDILYHTQDREFHLSSGLYSVAQRFGIEAAFRWARTLDAAALGCLLGLGLWMDLGPWYFARVGVAAAILVYKHRMISPADLSRLNTAFFRMNAYVSTTILLATLIAVLT